MTTIIFQQYCARFGDNFFLRNIDWEIKTDQHWAIIGPNGAGKSALAALLAGEGERLSGTLEGLPSQVATVSADIQAELIERERRNDESDISDVIGQGTPVHELLEEVNQNTRLLEELVLQFNFDSLLDRSFRKLSTGETRKLLLFRALISTPDLLILDEPFDGLDIDSTQLLRALLESQVERVAMIMILNRFDEIPEFITHIAYLSGGLLRHTVAVNEKGAVENLRQLLHLSSGNINIPPANEQNEVPPLNPDHALVQMRDVTIRYGEQVVFSNLDWRIETGQHWQLSGPNGSGKTCLLNLITGDHPQCYVNNIFVFGFQRGSGESIWEIKQYIGYVSSALQWDYSRVGTSVRNVILSGFHDSIGLYHSTSDQEGKIALQWLTLLGMCERANESFNQLSHGDQRLVLIARAMVKHPVLLILDEPCTGLDDMNRQLVLALIEKICADSETTVLYVTHHSQDKVSGIENHLILD